MAIRKISSSFIVQWFRKAEQLHHNFSRKYLINDFTRCEELFAIQRYNLKMKGMNYN